jgi:hypothetical protein
MFSKTQFFIQLDEQKTFACLPIKIFLLVEHRKSFFKYQMSFQILSYLFQIKNNNMILHSMRVVQIKVVKMFRYSHICCFRVEEDRLGPLESPCCNNILYLKGLRKKIQMRCKHNEYFQKNY